MWTWGLGGVCSAGHRLKPHIVVCLSPLGKQAEHLSWRCLQPSMCAPFSSYSAHKPVACTVPAALQYCSTSVL